MSKTHVARCACDQLRAACEGEPAVVSACHCLECQRRSGSPFGVGAFYNQALVRIEGAHKTFTRPAPEGRTVTNHFCPQCGTNLSWEADLRPGTFAIALGAFGDPDFTPPARSVFEESRHGWINFNLDIPRFPGRPDR